MFTKRLWLQAGVLLFFFLVLGRLTGIYQTFLVHNVTAVQVNRGISHPHLPMEKRLHALAASSQEAGQEVDSIAIAAALEYANLREALAYVRQTDEYHDFEPGPQLLFNPDFMYSSFGWLQYQSVWEMVHTAVAGDDTIITYSRQGEGHSSLSQTLQLENDTCYLFSVTASIERRDDVPTYWFYLETYDEVGKPIGQSLERSSGSQNWAHRFAPFCLPGSLGTTTKVTVAPVNLYGDATVYLGTVRLYRLLPSRK